jgi:hypothetical protein
MMPLLERLDAVASVTPEYEGEDVPGATQEMYESLLETYPGIAKFRDYTDVLRATGGIHADNREMDLALYGFGGYVVASFDEGNFLDRERYFLFGELLYPRTPSPEPVFLAFDTKAEHDAVYCLEEPGGEYKRCADSFRDLLTDLAERRYPCYPES